MPAPNNRTCQLETCERRHHANNYCEKHNRQVFQHGHVLSVQDISAHMKANRSKRKMWHGWAKKQSNHMACHYYLTYKRKLPKGMTWGHRRTS